MISAAHANFGYLALQLVETYAYYEKSAYYIINYISIVDSAPALVDSFTGIYQGAGW